LPRSIKENYTNKIESDLVVLKVNFSVQFVHNFKRYLDRYLNSSWSDKTVYIAHLKKIFVSLPVNLKINFEKEKKKRYQLVVELIRNGTILKDVWLLVGSPYF
jgi:hypothetical protein